MTDLTTRLVLDLRNDQLLRGLRASGVSVQQLSQNIDRSMRDSDRSVSRFARNARRDLGGLNRLTGGVFGKFKGEILALGSAWAGLSLLKDSAQLDKNLVRMTHTAGVARRETANMRKEYFAIQSFNGISVEASRMATDKMLQSGMSLNESLASTRAIANTSAVSHASTTTIADGLTVGAQTFGWDLAKEGVASDKLNKMYLAGDLGSAELENLSSIFAKVGTHAKSAGMTFEGTLAFIEQLSKTEKNPEKLATLAESTLRIFNNKVYQQKITEVLGTQFYKKDGSSRNPLNVLEELKTKWYDNQLTDEQRSNFFKHTVGKTDLDTQRGFKMIMDGGALEEMFKFRKQINTESTGRVEKALPASIDNGVDQTSRLKGALRESIDSIAMPVNKAVSSAIQFALDPKKAGGMGLDGGDLLLGGGAGLAALFGATKLAKKTGLFGGLIGGVAMGEVLEQSMGVTPVYVVNMPSSLGVPNIGRRTPSVTPGSSSNARTPRLNSPNNTPRLPSPTGGGSNSLGTMFQGLSQVGWRGLLARVGGFFGPLAATAGLGFTAGDLIDQGFSASDKRFGTNIKSSESDAILKMMAFFGSETAKQTVAIEKTLTQTPAKVQLDIKLDQTGYLKVDNIHSPDADVDFDITGGSMVSP